MATTGSEPMASGPFVQLAESDEYGPILVDSECRTLYGFTQDADGEPTCVDDCAANWPALLVDGDAVPPLADELDPALFSIVEHPDGPMLKVGDWPLYYFANDAAPGDVNGQGVGGFWWVVGADGTLRGGHRRHGANRRIGSRWVGSDRFDADRVGADDDRRLTRTGFGYNAASAIGLVGAVAGVGVGRRRARSSNPCSGEAIRGSVSE